MPKTINLQDARKTLVDMFTGLANNEGYARSAHSFKDAAKKLSECSLENLMLNIQDLAEFVSQQ